MVGCLLNALSRVNAPVVQESRPAFTSSGTQGDSLPEPWVEEMQVVGRVRAARGTLFAN